MQFLKSISGIDKVLPSAGSTPVVVLCDDLNYYACKYGKVLDLFNEYIAACFGKIWEIPIPDHCFVDIKPEHVTQLPLKQFEITCFGSLYLEHAMDINNFFATWTESNYELSKITNKYDLLKVALFDIWLSNEDRNHNNYNLLMQTGDNGNLIMAIDHVNILNSSTLEHGLVQISEYESVINSEFFLMLIRKNGKLLELVNDLEEKFYIWVKKCKEQLPDFLKFLPNNWRIDGQEMIDQFLVSIFSEQWLNESIQTFRTYLERQLNK